MLLCRYVVIRVLILVYRSGRYQKETAVDDIVESVLQCPYLPKKFHSVSPRVAIGHTWPLLDTEFSSNCVDLLRKGLL